MWHLLIVYTIQNNVYCNKNVIEVVNCKFFLALLGPYHQTVAIFPFNTEQQSNVLLVWDSGYT